MPYKLRRFTCPDCGKPVARRAKQGAVIRCTLCGIKHAADTARQMHSHRGPAYERWLANPGGAVAGFKQAEARAANRLRRSPTL